MAPGRLVYTFGPFAFDPQSGDLDDGRQHQTLRPQAARVLSVLVQRPGEVVTHDDFRRAAWDEGTHVDFDQALANALWEIRQVLGDDARAPAYVEVLPRRGHRFLAPVTASNESSGAARHDTEPPHAGPRRSAASPAAHRHTDPHPRVAVLPFDADDDHGALARGLADEVLVTLARTASVGVVSRTSSRHAARGRTLREVARHIDADFLLEGSLAAAGGRVRVAVGLVAFPDDTVVWAREYDRERTVPGAGVGDLGRRIARDVEVALSSAPAPGASVEDAADPELRRRYLRARVYVDRRVTRDVLTGVTLYRECVEQDALFAPAWSGLGYAHALAAWVGLSPRAVAVPKAVEAAERALALDARLCEAHVVLALAAVFGRRAWAEAEDEFARASTLRPDCPLSRVWCAWLRSWCGRHDEAVALAREAARLNPLSDTLAADLVRILFYARRDDEAIATAREARRLAPDDTYLAWSEALPLVTTGRLAGAIAQLEACRRENPHPAIASVLGLACGLAGDAARAEALLRDLDEQRRGEHVWTAAASLPLIGLGRLDEATACLERAWHEGDLWAEQLRVDPLLDPLRGRPRFEALVDEVGFPPATHA
jgi:TolB-like protein/tetratricopeptide (TPR) repeat protein